MPPDGLADMPPPVITPDEPRLGSENGRLPKLGAMPPDVERIPPPIEPIVNAGRESVVIEVARGWKVSPPPPPIRIDTGATAPPPAGIRTPPPMPVGSMVEKPPPIEPPDIAPYPPNNPPRPGS